MDCLHSSLRPLACSISPNEAHCSTDLLTSVDFWRIDAVLPCVSALKLVAPPLSENLSLSPVSLFVVSILLRVFRSNWRTIVGPVVAVRNLPYAIDRFFFL